MLEGSAALTTTAGGGGLGAGGLLKSSTDGGGSGGLGLGGDGGGNAGGGGGGSGSSAPATNSHTTSICSMRASLALDMARKPAMRRCGWQRDSVSVAVVPLAVALPTSGVVHWPVDAHLKGRAWWVRRSK